MDTNLEHNRHTLAHLLAAAIAEMYQHGKTTIGPAIDNGFYYDFDFDYSTEAAKLGIGNARGLKPTEADLNRIEEKMKELLPTWKEFKHKEVSEREARERFHDNPYKLELIDEIVARGEKITLYTCGGFTDLCRGGHAENPSKDISPDSFKLDRVAGAYWRGDEKNKMLTRIYGLSFATKEELEAYLRQREEAAKRDHRKLGRELDLFLTSELVGQGLPLWTPRGTIMRTELDTYVWQLREKHGYSRVTIPHITRKELYETSGHWAKFGDELFRIKTREGKEYAVKPMNCPHHTQIFARKPHSYREMPQRYAETTMVYRDEQSGELGGLTRVLSITQDDSHVFCRMSQVKEEYFRIWDIVDSFYGTFGFKLRVRLSFHDPKEFSKYLGTPEIWASAENALREIAEERDADYFEAQGEAAMYGPKLDFMATDSMDRQHQVATIQLDMNQPERFDLTCINEKGEKERIVMLHCAVMGSIERFSAVLLEHLAGNLPIWLSPVQVKILPVSEKHAHYAQQVSGDLLAVGIRAEIDDSDSLGKRIRAAKIEKVPYFVVIGDQEISDGTGTLESRDKGKIGALKIPEIVEKLSAEIKNRA